MLYAKRNVMPVSCFNVGDVGVSSMWIVDLIAAPFIPVKSGLQGFNSACNLCISYLGQCSVQE